MKGLAGKQLSTACMMYAQGVDSPDGVRKLGRHGAVLIPILLKTGTHRVGLLCGGREVEQDGHAVGILRCKCRARIVPIHANVFQPEGVIERLLEDSGVLRPGRGLIGLIQPCGKRGAIDEGLVIERVSFGVVSTASLARPVTETGDVHQPAGVNLGLHRSQIEQCW